MIVIAIGEIIETAISDHMEGLRPGKARDWDKGNSVRNWGHSHF
jgi:hypothetical protein